MQSRHIKVIFAGARALGSRRARNLRLGHRRFDNHGRTPLLSSSLQRRDFPLTLFGFRSSEATQAYRTRTAQSRREIYEEENTGTTQKDAGSTAGLRPKRLDRCAVLQ